MAIYIPTVRNYAPFYIQREADATAVNIRTTYGVTIMAHEYPSKRKVKQPYSNDWKDRDGDDEWVESLNYEAFTLELKCVIFTRSSNSGASRQEMKAAIRAFENAIRVGEFKIYDDWTKFGFRKVRLDEFPKISDGDFDEMDGHCRLIFNVSLKVNDPTTDMVLSNNSIVEA
jgi:hypothetical protein